MSNCPSMGCPTRCRLQSLGGAQIWLPVGGGLSLSGVASGGRVGDVGDGVEGEISDALPLGGRLDQSGCPDGLGGA